MITRRSFFATSSLALAAAGCRSFNSPCASECAAGKVKFRLGMAGYSCNRLSLDETLSLLKRLDVNWLCIKNFHLPFEATDAEIATFKAKCADHGVTGYGIGPIYMDVAEKDKVKTYFDFAKRVGVKTIVGVPFVFKMLNGKKTRYESRELCEYVSGLCKEYDIRYAIHNHGPDTPYLFPTGETTWNMVKDLDERMGLCLDIGHDFRAKADPADSIRKFHTRIFDMHIKNVRFDPVKNLAVPMPRGGIDMWKVVNTLVDVGYTGVCSLEYESFPPRGTKPGIKEWEVAESIGYFKGLMKAVQG
jgi:sugar phosphate isomerase/epimerase